MTVRIGELLRPLTRHQTAASLGVELGATGQTIANWIAGTAVPAKSRTAQLSERLGLTLDQVADAIDAQRAYLVGSDESRARITDRLAALGQQLDALTAKVGSLAEIDSEEWETIRKRALHEWIDEREVIAQLSQKMADIESALSRLRQAQQGTAAHARPLPEAGR